MAIDQKGRRPMEEDCAGREERMTPEEMQRFLNQEARDGTGELEAYRKLMYILGVAYPAN